MKKAICIKAFVFIAALLICSSQAAALTEEAKVSGGIMYDTTAEGAVLIAADTSEVLFAKDPEKRLPMASVTKLMTLLLAVEEVEKGNIRLDDTVRASENACSMGGSQIFLEPGEEFSFKEMLIAVAVGSANDASVAVAEQVAGSEEAFVAQMNSRAKELGCRNTNFVNTTGLTAENHYTSAMDMALILRECISHPLFMKVSSIYEYDLRGGDFKLWNTNRLLKWYTGVDAGKTGWTNEARFCLASTCDREGLRLIAVVLGTPEAKSHFRESIKLYNLGFAAYRAVKFDDAEGLVKTVIVDRGAREKVDLVPERKVIVVVKKGEDKGYEGKVSVPDRVAAPVRKGQHVGDYVVFRNNTEVMRVPLVAASEVQRRTFSQQLENTVRNLIK